MVVFFILTFFKNHFFTIIIKISNKHIYNVKYEDIEKVTVKQYPNGPYVLFIFLKNPSMYLDNEQMERMAKARQTIPEAGDIAINDLLIKENKIVVLDLINFYLEQYK